MLRLPAKIGVLLSLGVLTLGALADTTQTPPPPHKTVHRKPAKTKAAQAPPAVDHVVEVKKATRPKPVEIPPMTPEQLPAQAPQVNYQDGKLTVDSENSTMKDILAAIRKQAGMQMDLPSTMGTDRVAAHLSGSPQDVISSLLDGTAWDYIIVGSPTEPDRIQQLIVTSAGGGIATSLTRSGNSGLFKAAAIPGEPGTTADDQQADAEDQPASDETPDQAEPDQSPTGEESAPGRPPNQPPAGQPPPGTPGAGGVPPNQSPSSSIDPNQPQSIDQFNQNARRQFQPPQQPQQPPPPQQKSN